MASGRYPPAAPLLFFLCLASFAPSPSQAVDEKLADDVLVLEDMERSWGERAEAAKRLAGAGPAAVEPLAMALKVDDHWKVRQNAAYALGAIGDPLAVEPLIEALSTDENVYVRAEAAESLGRIGDARAVDALRAALKDDETAPDVVDGEEVEVAIVAAAARNSLSLLGVEVGGTAAAGAGKKRPRAAPPEKKATARAAKPAEKPAAGTDGKRRRRSVPFWLAPVYEPGYKASGDVKTLLDAGEQWHRRADAARRLGVVGGEAAVDALVKALKDDAEPFVRREAARALGSLKARRAADALEAALADPDPWVRVEAAGAVEAITGRKVEVEAPAQEQGGPRESPGAQEQEARKGRIVIINGGEEAADEEDEAAARPWAVNLATYGTRADAEGLAALVERAGFNAYITELLYDGDTLYRVRVGFFPSGEQARRVANELAMRFSLEKTWIVVPSEDEVEEHGR
ncbi:MAG TPA: hypothetical protein ENJ37_08450 [Deltaproteobacteria bacterium]|nr:hypothetical protein [Deltaproteobacteria bacterium]